MLKCHKRTFLGGPVGQLKKLKFYDFFGSNTKRSKCNEVKVCVMIFVKALLSDLENHRGIVIGDQIP